MSSDMNLMRRLSGPCLLLPLLGLQPGLARAQDSAPLYDPRQLPAFAGRVELFTLTPRGDIDGFVLTDGTEVKTPPHLTAQLAAVVKPGDSVTIHGLKAAALPLVQAVSVTDDANGRTVIDNGPDAPGAGPPPPPAEAVDRAPVAEIQGRVRMPLHGPRGDVNGVLMEDGSILKLPPPEAARLISLLKPGQPLAAEGIRRTSPLGSVIDVTAVGRTGDRLTPVDRDPRPPT